MKSIIRYRVSSWVGDPGSDGGMVALCQSRGVPMQCVEKKSGSVQFGIGIHQELIRTKYHKIFSTCTETEKEYAQYSYPRIQEGKPLSDNPVKIMDDLCDANRYVSMHYKYLRDKAQHPVFERPKTHLEKLLAGEFKTESISHDGMD